MNHHWSWTLVGPVLALCLVGCGPLGAGGDDDNGGGGHPDAAQPLPQLDGGGGGGSGGGGGGTSNCHEQTFQPTRVGDPDIMLVVDLSTSMDDGTQSPSIWDTTTQAISQTITNLGPSAPIAWGLIFFPVDGACGGPSAPTVNVSLGNGDQIVSSLAAATPNGSTPTHKGIDLARSYLDGLADGRGHYILLATDGEPNCDPTDNNPMPTKRCQSDAECAATEMCFLVPPLGGMCKPRPLGLGIHAIENALAAGIKTFVVGLSIGAANAETLNRMADAGGAPASGATRYYSANDQAQLETALSTITSQVISCTFALDSPPLDIDYVYVSVGGTPVDRDLTRSNGWDVDASTLVFYGAACQSLQASPDSVQIIYGCPPVS